jgi:hypothetical protein
LLHGLFKLLHLPTERLGVHGYGGWSLRLCHGSRSFQHENNGYKRSRERGNADDAVQLDFHENP